MTEEHNGHNGANGGAAGTALAEEVTKRVITRKSLELPRTDFADIRPLVEAMVSLNGPASRKLIFDQAGASASGGTAKKKWAALGYFGFRDDLGGGRHDVSDRGRAFLSDDPDSTQRAKQHALVDTGFRSLIDRFSGSPVNPNAIAGVLRDDLGVPEPQAKAAAKLLVELATEAGFILEGSFKVALIEQAMAAVAEKSLSKPGVRASAARARPKPDPAPAPHQFRAQQPDAPIAAGQPTGAAPEPRSEGRTGPFDVSVEIKIDAKDHTPEEIGQILREAKAALEMTAD